jgi:hypothetical protein
VLDGQEVIADPGTYSYDDLRWRNASRATMTHATLMVDGQEQCAMDPKAKWVLPDTARARIDAVTQEADRLCVIGRHEGYSRLAAPVVHRRRIEAVRGPAGLAAVVIADVLEPVRQEPAEHDLVWSFPLGPGLQVALDASGAVVRDADGAAVLRVTWSPAVQAADEPGWYAEEYGRHEAARVLRLRGRLRLQEPMQIRLEPLRRPRGPAAAV